jgi:predicted PurR-regulated permease PerM
MAKLDGRHGQNNIKQGLPSRKSSYLCSPEQGGVALNNKKTGNAMNTVDTAAADRNFQKNAMASFVQIAAVALLVVWCFQIVAPFLSIVLWGLIIAVALYPVHVKLSTRLGGREKLSATIFVLVGLAILLVPTYILTDSSIAALKTVGAQLEEGSVSISPPDASVAEWPLIGEQVHQVWSDAATNLEETLNKFEDQLKSLGRSVISFAGSMAVGVLQFVASFIIAGVFLVSAEGGYRVSQTLASSLAGDRGKGLTDLSVATIRSVAKGVLGVAIIQAILSAIGLVVAGIPAAGIWTFAVLMLAIMQLPPIIILGPIAVWFFSTADTVPATIFLVFALVVSASDGVLKPMFLGRGVEIPMLVILLGAIGGMILLGIVGLFIGAIVLALGYQILMAWMETDELNNPRQPAETAGAD